MVSIIIGNDERKIEAVDSDWINQQITNRRILDEHVCVQILINSENINIALQTEDCPAGQFVTRDTSKAEQEIFDLWDKMGLNRKDFQPNTLIDFLVKMNGFR